MQQAWWLWLSGAFAYVSSAVLPGFPVGECFTVLLLHFVSGFCSAGHILGKCYAMELYPQLPGVELKQNKNCNWVSLALCTQLERSILLSYFSHFHPDEGTQASRPAKAGQGSYIYFSNTASCPSSHTPGTPAHPSVSLLPGPAHSPDPNSGVLPTEAHFPP